MKITGYCPMGCGQTLFVADGGHITCSLAGCPNPGVVDELLDNRETEHIAVLTDDDIVVLHPLRERLNDLLLSCALVGWGHRDTPVQAGGRYRVTVAPTAPSGWHWERLP